MALNHRSFPCPGARVGAALLAVGAVLAATPAAAATARLAALGGNADYVADERAVLRWYAAGVDHHGLAVFELGRFDTGGGGQPWSSRIAAQSGGVHARLGRHGRFGTAAAWFHTDAVQAAPSGIHAAYPGGSFSLAWARTWGAWDLGLGFRGTTSGRYEFDEASPVVGREDYRHDWGLGARRSLGDRLALEVAGEIRNVMFGLRDDDRQIRAEDSGSRSYGLRARLRWAVSPEVTLMPLVDYTRDIHLVYAPALGDVATQDAWQLRAGAGCTVARPGGDRLVFSAEYRHAREDQDGLGSLYRDYDRLRRRWWAIHVRAGAESAVLPWLTVRASLQYRRVDDERSLTWLDPVNPPRYGHDLHLGVDTPLGLGLTVAAGRFRLDAAYNDQAPLSLATVPDADAPREAANFATVSLRYLY
ncbi:MAG: hypothetical protein R6X35_09825 [Candidatus Krumholzibacteriia bacterium]